MVQPSPELPALRVRKRDGRSVAFDAARVETGLRRALAATGREDAALAHDLAAVVATYLRGRAGEGLVASTEIAHLVHEVLLGAGCTAAAAAFRVEQEARDISRRRLRIRPAAGDDGVRGIPPAEATDPEEWSKGRVVSLLAREADMPGALAEEVAADVERGLFASGLRSVSPALLREWIDNELALRGLPARLGRHQFVGLASHELRDVLGSPTAGLAAEHELGARLVLNYALREVVPSEVARAHDEGLLDLETLRAGARLDAIALRPWGLPALAAHAGRRERVRELPLLLRPLGHLAAREVVLEWDGPALAAEDAADLLGRLAEPAGMRDVGARFVLLLPAGRPALVEPFLAALETLRAGPGGRSGAVVPGVRLAVEGLPDGLLARAAALEAEDARLSFAVAAPAAGVLAAAVSLDVARLALAAGPRALREFLAALEAAADLAVQALHAQQALLPAAGVRAARRVACGLSPAALPARQRLGLCGWSEAATLLLGDAPRARDNRLDLAAAMGERLAAVLARHAARLDVALMPAGSGARERFGRLDLAAFPDARDRLPLAGHREGYRYDGAVPLLAGEDAAAAGAQSATLSRSLGLSADVPVPRSTGSAAQRVAFLQSFARTAATPRDVAPCA